MLAFRLRTQLFPEDGHTIDSELCVESGPTSRELRQAALSAKQYI